MDKLKILADEFLDELRERAESGFKGRLHESFIDWFVEAEFGSLNWKFTDNVHDGGIDAIVWRPGDDPAVIIIQSKFHENVGKGRVAARTYKELNEVVRSFRYGGDVFDEWLSRVRPDLKPVYRKALEALCRSRSWFQQKKAFRLISTSSRGDKDLEARHLPHESFLYYEQIVRLYEQFRQGETPRSRDLHLQIDNKLPYKDQGRGITSFLVNSRVADLRRYLEDNDVARLVAKNVRYNLGGKIGDRIRLTYERHPEDFWYFHNGLTIVCDDFIESNNRATLVAPSVINGAQTLYALSGSGKKTGPAEVTTRIIVRPDPRAQRDSEWLLELIRSVNSQNPVQEADLRSNEPEQLFLQSKFREYGVYYERKRGEWREVRNEPRYKGFNRVSMRLLGQALTACAYEDGHGVRVVKTGTDKVFLDPNYRIIFPSRHRIPTRFEHIYFVYRLVDFLGEQGYPSSDVWRRERHAFWNTLWILHRGIAPHLNWKAITAASLQTAFDEIERKHTRRARRARSAVRFSTQRIWAAYKRFSRRDPYRWSPNNFFKQTPGIEWLGRRVQPELKKQLRQMARDLAVSATGPS